MRTTCCHSRTGRVRHCNDTTMSSCTRGVMRSSNIGPRAVTYLNGRFRAARGRVRGRGHPNSAMCCTKSSMCHVPRTYSGERFRAARGRVRGRGHRSTTSNDRAPSAWTPAFCRRGDAPAADAPWEIHNSVQELTKLGISCRTWFGGAVRNDQMRNDNFK